jgi:hypothetical protein
MTKKPSGPEPGEKGILSDHKKVGKKLLPPFNYMLPTFEDFSYIDMVLPEIVWIALLHHGCGLREGAEFARALSKAAIESAVREKKAFYGHVGAYADLAAEERRTVVSQLEAAGVLEPLRRTLLPLATFYPECPLSFLWPDGLPTLPDSEAQLSEFKRVMWDLHDKASPPAIFAMATFMHLGFLAGAVRVKEGLVLEKFPEIEKYPSTELSRQVAAGIRVVVLSYLGIAADRNPPPWPQYFWNRGLELDKCDFGDDDD